MILFSSPLKNDPPPRNHGKHIFFPRNSDSDNKNSQLKKFDKNLSSASVDNERP